MLVVAVNISVESVSYFRPCTNQSSYLYSTFQLDRSFNCITNHNQIKPMVVQMFFFMIYSLLRRKLLVLLMILVVIAGFGQAGIAPVSIPINGFKIDGFLQRQSVNAGDWLA